jgi:hypothetical protein
MQLEQWNELDRINQDELIQSYIRRKVWESDLLAHHVIGLLAKSMNGDKGGSKGHTKIKGQDMMRQLGFNPDMPKQ